MANESENGCNDLDKKMESLGQLVTCSICLDWFRQPLMLPCQHTFCQICLSKIATQKSVQCPQCRMTTSLTSEGVTSLPVNIHLQSVIEVLQTDTANKITCTSCQNKADNSPNCGHCQLQYCTECYAKHASEMMQKLNKMAEELKEKIPVINEDLKNFQEECKLANSNIRQSIETKITALKNSELSLIGEVDSSLRSEESAAQVVIERIDFLLNKIKNIDCKEDTENMDKLFLECREEISQLNSEITNRNSRRRRKVVFDSHSLTINWKEKEKENSITEPNENVERHSRFYIMKQFHLKCKLVSEMMQRPSGTAVSPWSSEFYVVSTDTNLIHVFDLQNGRLVSSFGRRGHKDGEFLCPFGIALCPIQHKIYITDKWKHCIHVFSKDGEYLHHFGSKGRASSQFRSPESICVDGKGNVYICDTCNNRIQVFNSDGRYHHQIGVLFKKEGGKMRQNSMFQDPTGIAVTKDGSRVVVSDFGHHRIHVFSFLGDHLFTFGQKGNLKGQFLHPECVTVDKNGFILVGDSGNGRIQIFRPDGSYVRMLGCKDFSKEKFNWVSGIAVTDNYEIVVCDFKNHCVQMYL